MQVIQPSNEQTKYLNSMNQQLVLSAWQHAGHDAALESCTNLPARCSFRLAIADLVCEVETSSDFICECLSDKTLGLYSTFAPPDFRLRLESPAGFDFACESADVLFGWCSTEALFQRRDFVGKVNLTKREATFLVDPNRSDTVHNSLRTVYSLLTPFHDGFLLHAAGLLRGEDAFIFYGKSGAGKSTIAKTITEPILLTDEILLCRRREGSWTATGTPFCGEVKKCSPLRGQIRMLLALKKNAETRLALLKSAQACTSILGSVLAFSHPMVISRLAYLARDLINAVPSYECFFTLDSSVIWRQIRDECGIS